MVCIADFQMKSLVILLATLCPSEPYNYAASKLRKPYYGPGSSALVHRYTASSYYFTDYRKSKSKFKPSNQYCPSNGMTVCEKVKGYPEVHIHEVVSNVKARNFNFSSVFFDERNGDQTPKFGKTADNDGYVVYQHSIQYDYHVPAPSHLASYYETLASNEDWKNEPKKDQQYPLPKDDYTHHRRGRAEDAESPCRSRTKFIIPKAAMNEHSKWKYVVNVAKMNPEYQQVVKVEVCEDAGEICSEEISLPFGFKQSCRQKYIKKKMLALQETGDSVSEENFFIPSCCICEISRGDDFKRKKRAISEPKEKAVVEKEDFQ